MKAVPSSTNLGPGVCQHVSSDPDELSAQTWQSPLGVTDQELQVCPLGDSEQGTHVQVAPHHLNKVENLPQFPGTNQICLLLLELGLLSVVFRDEHDQSHQDFSLPGQDHQSALVSQVVPDHPVKIWDPISRLQQTDGDVHWFLGQEVKIEELDDLIMIGSGPNLERYRIHPGSSVLQILKDCEDIGNLRAFSYPS